MNKKHGILIRPNCRLIADVHAAIWNGMEMRKRLLLHDEPIVFRDLRNDTLALNGKLNRMRRSAKSCRSGFELFGEIYYGDALIIPDEGRNSPRITPEHLAHIVRFLDVDEEIVAHGQAGSFVRSLRYRETSYAHS